MSGRQRIILAVLAMATVIVLGMMAVVVVRSLARLPSLLTLTALPRPTITRPPTGTPTPWPTRTPILIDIPTRTPIPLPTSTPTPFPPSRHNTSGPYFAPTRSPGQEFATLDDFWTGSAEWVIEKHDVGLPVGESDTVNRGNGEFWSYLHASYISAGVVDTCGKKVPYPGCVTLWKSYDGGLNFTLENPVCLFPCEGCPCDETDHVQQQQYPRVFFDDDLAYMVYEWGGGTFMRTSTDGIHWSGEMGILGTGVWYTWQKPCGEAEAVGKHPHILEPEFDCLAGAPPGIYIEGDLLYIFVGLGRAPGHMGCLVGNKHDGVTGLRKCLSNPLFGTDEEQGYGPLDAMEAEANPYFDFRTISSADVVRVGDHYYIAYEGTRGPSDPSDREDQFALGFARSISPTIDGPWEKYPGNPVITDLGDKWGVGHADIVVMDQVTYLYTSTSPTTRGRYVLVFRRDNQI